MAEESTVKKSRRERRRALVPTEFRPRFWEDSDARVAVVKTIKRRVELLREHAGGHESYQRDLLVQRAAFISIILETQEVRAAEGGDLDLGSYVQAVNSLSGLLIRLGLQRHVKNVTDLQAYLNEKESANKSNGHHRRHSR